jgi:arylsulfatase A-like enzyme
MAERLNILHIICHDLGRHLNCYGRPDVPSPTLDRLASEGVRFENCFAASPPCSPARGSLMTGRYAHTNGQVGLCHRGFPLPDNERTITDYLNDAGYLTANIGFQHERDDPLANRYQYNDQRSRDSETVASNAAAFLQAQAGRSGRPFYLNAGFSEVHLPFTRPVYTPDDPSAVSVPAWLPDNRGVREELARFNGAIRWMDQSVGVILDALRDSGLDRTTLVMFTTDHGMAFPRAKGTLYTPGIGVTLIMRMPEGRGRRGVVREELISSIDIAPTLLEAAGAPPAEAIQGRSFLGLLTGGGYEPRDAVFAEKNYHDCYDPVRSVRTRWYAYLRNFEPRPKIILSSDLRRSSASDEMWPWASEPRDGEELYDLEADPYEMTNLAARPELAAVKAELSRRVDQWMTDTDDPLLRGPVPASPGARVDPPDLPDEPA